MSALPIEIFKGDEEVRSIGARLSQPPEELVPAIRELFALPPARPFRLRTARSVLDVDRPLGEQGVTAGTLLQVDVGYRVEVSEPWARTVAVLDPVFGSEECEQLRSRDLSQPQRLVYGGQTLDTHGDIADAFRPHGAPQLGQFSVALHLMRDVSAVARRSLNETHVWPTAEAGKVGVMVPPHKAALMFAGELWPKAAQVCDMSLPEYGLILAGPVAVHVRLSSGRRRVVRAPGLGTVADVCEAVRSEESGHAFVLRRGGADVEDDTRLCEGGGDVGPELVVRRTKMEVRVFACGRNVSWRTERRRLWFTDVAHKLAAATGIGYAAIEKKCLSCVGCGRRVTKHEEEFQCIPAACCRVQSLSLAELTPRATRESGTQTAGQRRSRSSVSAKPQTCDRRVQATAPWLRAASQTPPGPATAAIGIQATARRSVFAQQQPPPPRRPLHIVNWTPFGLGYGHEFKMAPALADPVTVGAVLAAVTAELEVAPGTVGLRRTTARGRRGDDLFEVSNDNDEVFGLATHYGDAKGKVFTARSVKDKRPAFLFDSGSVVRLVPDRRNVFQIIGVASE